LRFARAALDRCLRGLEHPGMSGAAILPFVPRQREPRRQSAAGALVVPLHGVVTAPPPRPAILPTCVAWLQEDAALLSARPLALQALRDLEFELFESPGRAVGLHRIWHESIATACTARLLSAHLGLDAGLMVAAALLHRLGDLWPTEQLAAAWQLAPAVTQVLAQWRHCMDHLEPGPVALTAARAVYLSHLFAVEQLYSDYCTPGIIEVAARELGVPMAVIGSVRAEAAGIDLLLGKLG
jgi:hypothetical protein